MWGVFKVGDYVYVCVYVYVIGYPCMYLCMCLCMCMYMYICMCMHVYVYVCVYVCMFIYLCIYMCVYVYIYIYIYIYYIYICICIDTSYLPLLSGLDVVGTLFWCYCCWLWASECLLGISDFNDNDIFDWFFYFVVIFCSIRLSIIFYCKYYQF